MIVSVRRHEGPIETVDDLVCVLWAKHNTLVREPEGKARTEALRELKQLISMVERFSLGTPLAMPIQSHEEADMFSEAEMSDIGEVVLS